MSDIEWQDVVGWAIAAYQQSFSKEYVDLGE